jgi:dTDP-4-amino-4,6-dideoxygalactose transaminase
LIKPFDKPIYVTKPWPPPLEEFQQGLTEIWARAWLTNSRPVVERFGAELAAYCETENLCLFANGTLALQIALQGMGITGDVITTPYTFVASVHSLFWNKVRPIFVDIEPEHYTLDPERVEAAITPWTSAILGVHVYGHPSRLQELERIARQGGNRRANFHCRLLIADCRLEKSRGNSFQGSLGIGNRQSKIGNFTHHP